MRAHLTIDTNKEKNLNKNGRIHKIFSAKMHSKYISSKNLCHFSTCVYTFMPSIFHLFFNSLSIRRGFLIWQTIVNEYAVAHTHHHSWYIFAWNRQNSLNIIEKYLLPKFNTWKSATFTSPFDRAENQFYSISREKWGKNDLFPRKMKIKMTGMSNNVLCVWVSGIYKWWREKTNCICRCIQGR